MSPPYPHLLSMRHLAIDTLQTHRHRHRPVTEASLLLNSGYLQEHPVLELVTDDLFEDIEALVEAQVDDEDWQQHGMLRGRRTEK